MKDQMLKIAGVKSEKEFYKKFPTEEAFMKVHGKKLQKAAMGKTMVNKQLKQLTDFGNPPIAQNGAFKPLSFQDNMDSANAMNQGLTKERYLENQKIQNASAALTPQQNEGMSDMLSMGMDVAGQFMGGEEGGGIPSDIQDAIASGFEMKNGGYVMIPKAQFGAIAGALKGIGQKSGGIGNMLGDMIGGKGTSKGIMDKMGPNGLLGKDGPGLKSLGNAGGLGDAGKAAGLGILNAAPDIINGIGQMKEQKNQQAKAQQAVNISGLVKEATTSNPVQMQKHNFARPEDALVQPGQLGAPQGTGSNFLQMRAGGEIQNTYAPGTIYDNLEEIPSAEFGDYFQSSGQASIGKGVGSAIGSVFGGPLGGKIGGMVGSVAGNLLGGAKDANKLAALQSQNQKNIMETAGAQMLSGIRSNFGSFMEQGGYVSHNWQPQVITKFGEYNTKDLLKPDPTMDTLRSGGHLAQVGYTAPNASGLQTMAMGGNLQTHWGGGAEPMSYNPYIPGGGETVMFRGQSHDDTNSKGQSGIGITYGDNPVEVERGEPMTEMNDGGVVFGNMKIDKFAANEINDPKAKGMKYKNYVADLSKTEAKQNKIMNKASLLAINADQNDPFGRLALNSSQASLIGANMKLKDIADKKQNAAAVQNAILETAEERGLVSDELAQGKIKTAKFGGKFTAQNGSIVELLAKDKQKTDKSSRAALAESLGIVKKAKDYTGSAKQNTALYEAYSKKKGSQDQLVPVKIGNAPQLYPIAPDPIPDYVTADDYGNYYDANDKIVDQSGNLPGVFKANQIATGKGEKTGTGWKDVANTMLSGVMPLFRPTDQEPLDPSQLYPEMMALASNQLEPVQAQKFQPLLQGAPSDISYQDQLNEITAQSRAAERMMQNNPEAAAALFAQVAQAKGKVLADQFRANQERKEQVYAGNRNMLNQSQAQNLQILDQQYQRQAQAKSNTKAQALEAMKSIADKTAKNKLENRQLGIMENMYNYRFGQDNRAFSYNDPYDFNMSGKGSGTGKQTAPPGFKFTYNEDGSVADMKPIKAKDGASLNSSIVKSLKRI